MRDKANNNNGFRDQNAHRFRDLGSTFWVKISDKGPVSRRSRNFSGLFRVTQFSLYFQNKGVSRHETLQLFLFLFPLQHMKRPALQNKQVVLLQMAFWARKVLGTYEKRAPLTTKYISFRFHVVIWQTTSKFAPKSVPHVQHDDFFIIQPIKLLSFGSVVAVPVVIREFKI